MLELSVVGTRVRSISVSCLAAVVLLAGCSASSPNARKPGEQARPKVVTVPALKQMALQGTPIGVILSQIDSSGTVYRLNDQQADDLRASGIPASIMSYIDQGYQRAILKNPELAKSDAQWHEIDGYWYGGLPFGWPRDWVVGAPAPGQIFR